VKDIKITDLQDKFVERNVPPYGRVLMIPGKDFDPDWEAALEDLGFGCVFTEINGEKFTLVRLEKEEGEESTAEPGPGAGKFLTNWSRADKERLFKRMEESSGTIEEKVAQLVSEFPGRTATGLLKKYQKLKRKRKKDAKAVGKSLTKRMLEERGKSEPVPHGDVEDLPRGAKEEYVSVPAAEAQLDIVKTLDRIEEMVKMDHGIIIRLNCAIVMQGLEAEERRGLLTIPPKLREHYLDALLRTWDDRVVEAFLAKTRALLEASS
jgi:hypothetical protein